MNGTIFPAINWWRSAASSCVDDRWCYYVYRPDCSARFLVWNGTINIDFVQPMSRPSDQHLCPGPVVVGRCRIHQAEGAEFCGARCLDTPLLVTVICRYLLLYRSYVSYGYCLDGEWRPQGYGSSVPPPCRCCGQVAATESRPPTAAGSSETRARRSTPCSEIRTVVAGGVRAHTKLYSVIHAQRITIDVGDMSRVCSQWYWLFARHDSHQLNIR